MDSERRQARREARSRELARRRRHTLAGLSLVLVAAAVAAVALLVGGGSSTPSSHRVAVTAPRLVDPLQAPPETRARVPAHPLASPEPHGCRS